MGKIILFLLFCAIFLELASGAIVITEVSSNPIGNSTSIPGDLSHEYIEVLNTGPGTISVNQLYIKTESATSSAEADSNDLIQWSGDSLRDIGLGTELRYPDVLEAGEVAVVLGRKYISAPESSWYKFPEGTIILGTRKTYLKSGGLPNSTSIISLFVRGSIAVSTYNASRSISVDPGEGMSWNRVHPDSNDIPTSWIRSAPNPGTLLNFSGGGKICNDLQITEFMAYPNSGSMEWLEILNNCNDTISLAGWRLRTGDREGWLTTGSEYVAPHTYVLVVGTMPINDPLLNGRLTKIIKAEYWGGLGNNEDIISLRQPDGSLGDSVNYTQEWVIKKGLSKEKINDKWLNCCKVVGSTPGESAFDCGAITSVQNVKMGGRRLKRGCSEPEGALSFIFEKSFTGSIVIYNLKGNKIAELQKIGDSPKSTIQWDGRFSNGEFVEPGVYFADIQSPTFNQRTGFTVLKGCE
jgi:hypothetical protein